MEILQALGGSILPPNPDTGANDPANPLRRVSYMGAGVLCENPGRFSETFEERLGEGSFYVRVFDQPTPGGSLYYLDSAVFLDNGSVEHIDPKFADSVWKLIGTGAPDIDSDGDGIPDALEMELGLDPGNPDTNQDGWGDLAKVLNEHLNPGESEPLIVHLWSPLEEDLHPASPEDRYRVGWWTFPGPLYRLEFHPHQVDAPDDPEEGYIEIWSGTVAEGEDEKIVGVDEVLDLSPTGFFRVRAVLP